MNIPNSYELRTAALVAPDLEFIEGGWRVRTVGDYHVDVMVMIYNYRVCSTPVALPHIYDRGFCFAGKTAQTLLAAIAAAKVWDPNDPEDEPPGWNKNVRTGEWREPKHEATTPTR